MKALAVLGILVGFTFGLWLDLSPHDLQAKAQSQQDVWPYEIGHFHEASNGVGEKRGTKVYKQVYQGCEIFYVVGESADASANSVAIALGRGCK